MKLIPRRKKDPTPLERGLGIFSKVFQALAAVRLARGALKGYRFVKRLPLLLGGAAVAAFAAKKLRGGSGADQPPASTSSPAASSMPTPPPAPEKPGATDPKSRAEAAVASSAGLADAETAAEAEDGATDEDAGTQKPA